MIESVNNERVKNWTKLNDKKFQESSGKFLVEGEHLVEEAKKACLLEEVIVQEGCTYDFEVVTIVSENVMKKISSLATAPKIIGVCSKIKEREIEGNVLLLDGIADPGNLGTIIRSSVAFGIDTVVLGDNTVSVYNPKVVRATEGMLFHVNIVEANLEKLVLKLKSDGYHVYVTDVTNGVSLKNVKFKEKNAIIIGSEAKGVSSELKSLADENLYIDMMYTCESLNAGVATSIILYELNR